MTSSNVNPLDVNPLVPQPLIPSASTPSGVNLNATPEQVLLKKKLLENSTTTSATTATTNEDPAKLTVFRMKFKKGPISQEVFFEFPNDQRLAEVAAREYCGRFRLRFIWVEKLYIDIKSIPTEVAEADS